MTMLFKNSLKIMGILNVTPDSFSDGGLYNQSVEKSLAKANELIEQGAHIIDIGGESTRPDAKKVSAKEEEKRVMPVIEEITKNHPSAMLSIDTYKAAIAKKALQKGAQIINDVWGTTHDSKMLKVVKEYDAQIIINHWEEERLNEKNALQKVTTFFETILEKAARHKIAPNKMILDPGIGFNKTPEANLVLLKNLEHFKKLGCKILIGTSRKSFIGLITDQKDASKRLSGTLATSLWAWQKGANILRVHDVKEHKDMIDTISAIQTEKLPSNAK